MVYLVRRKLARGQGDTFGYVNEVLAGCDEKSIETIDMFVDLANEFNERALHMHEHGVAYVVLSSLFGAIEDTINVTKNERDAQNTGQIAGNGVHDGSLFAKAGHLMSVLLKGNR